MSRAAAERAKRQGAVPAWHQTLRHRAPPDQRRQPHLPAATLRHRARVPLQLQPVRTQCSDGGGGSGGVGGGGGGGGGDGGGENGCLGAF